MKTKLLRKIRKRFSFGEAKHFGSGETGVYLCDRKNNYICERFDTLYDAIIASVFMLGYRIEFNLTRSFIKRKRDG